MELFRAYQRSLELFALVVADVAQDRGARRLQRAVSQQLASADSVCSNIQQGYGREGSVEYRGLLIIARGSLRGRQGRYRRLRHGSPPKIVEERTGLAEEIKPILSAAIPRLTSR